MRQVNSRTFVIAEAGVNHNGDPALARALVDVAGAAGADAVKFQTFTVDRLLTRRAAKAEYQQRATGSEQSQYEMLARLELSPSDHEMLFAHCAKVGIEFMSTPFDPESARYLKRLGVRRIKISSGDVTNLPMLEVVGALGLPVVLSTGMADMAEVEAAVATLRGAGATDLAILQCVSNYPADPALTNLRVMDTFARAFGAPVRPVATTRRASPCRSRPSRAGPPTSRSTSRSIGACPAPITRPRCCRTSCGRWWRPSATSRPRWATASSGRPPSELPVRDVARKSLVAARDLPGGAILTREDLDVLRPGTGLSPAALPAVLGRRTTRAIAHHTPITEDMLQS